MTRQQTLKEVLKHPWTVATSAVAVLGGILKVPLLLAAWQGLFATADALFGTLAALLFLADYVSFIKSDWIIPPAVVVVVIVALKRGTKWYDKFEDYLET